MNGFLEFVLWLLTDLLLAMGIATLPSFFGIFCLITAIFILPLEGWQALLKKLFKKPAKIIIYLLCSAIFIIEFPYANASIGIDRLLNPPPSSDPLVISFQNYKPFPSDVNYSSDSNASSKKDLSYQNSASNYASLNSHTTPEMIKDPDSNSGVVYRTPNGKRYHFSKTCGGKTSYEVTFDDAVSSGLTPCKKCVK